MPKLIAFNSVSLDGYFIGENGDLSWAHGGDSQDAEWQAYVSENARGNGRLVFGRVTYEMMAGWWPTPAALQAMPEVARGMNAMPKVVFSKTLREATWDSNPSLSGAELYRSALQDSTPALAPDAMIQLGMKRPAGWSAPRSGGPGVRTGRRAHTRRQLPNRTEPE